jgi:hypothetical protein
MRGGIRKISLLIYDIPRDIKIKGCIMKTQSLKSFIRVNQKEILVKVDELSNFGPEDICMLKDQVVRGIGVRNAMKVVSILEMRDLYIGLIAIRVVEKERGWG